MRNKLIAACLIAALCFTFTACGNPKIEWGDDGMAFCAEYDYGLKAGSEGLMLGTLDKLNYSDLEGEQDTLKETTAKAIEEAGLGKYELEAFFEKLPESVEEAAEKGYDMGDMLYCMGTEEENMELGVLETAAYHNPTENKYYQYIIYNSKTYYGAENVDGQKLADLLMKDFGIKADPKKIEAAAKGVEEKSLNSSAEDISGGEDEEVELSDDDIVIEDDGDEASEEGDAEEIEIAGDDAEEGEEAEESEGVEFEEVDPSDVPAELLEEGEEEDSEDADAEEGEDSEEIDLADLSGEDTVFIDEDGNEISLEELEEGAEDEYIEGEDGEEGDYVEGEEGAEEELKPTSYLSQELEYKGDGYTDMVTVYIISEDMGEENIGIYMTVDIKRCYDEQ